MQERLLKALLDAEEKGRPLTLDGMKELLRQLDLAGQTVVESQGLFGMMAQDVDLSVTPGRIANPRSACQEAT